VKLFTQIKRAVCGNVVKNCQYFYSMNINKYYQPGENIKCHTYQEWY